MSAPVRLDLSAPPEVINIGRGTHGVHGLEDTFQLPELWSLHLYGYHAELEVDGCSHPVAPGIVSLVPPASLIRYRYLGPSTHLYAHLKADRAEPRSGDHPGGRLQLIMNPGGRLPVITDLLRSAVAAATTRPAQTRCDVWSVLLRLDDPPRTGRPRAATDHLTAAMSYIESQLPEAITVPEIAARIGISANHLTRIFGAELGETVVGYVRRRRIDHARRLLSGSTMSIPAISASVGFADLQAFNKACRAVTGLSPRRLRRLGGPL
ncbi:MAG: helix-turn-helix transcriptional regulator [Microlunatus sp.]|nr:helix-turn-helix transcriptional regulator [Microlunatus sp.]